MEWFEELPEDCPPNNAIVPPYEWFFRVAEQYPPLETDFYSHRKLYPRMKFKTNECRARSVSIYNNLMECAQLLKLPLHKDKKIVQLKLTPESGVILQTGRNRTHYSWWRSNDFDPIPECKEVDLSLL